MWPLQVVHLWYDHLRRLESNLSVPNFERQAVDNQDRKHLVLGSFSWKLMERFGVMAVQIVVQTVLARLLMPADFGVIALVSVFIALANVLVVSGLGTALVQKKSADAVDLSSVFYASVAVAVALFALNFLAAQLVADFYQRQELVWVMRTLAASLLLTPLNIVQNALVARNLLFKKVFFNSSVATLLSGGVGVGLAMAGYGVWALVAQTVSSQVLLSALLWMTIRWRPTLQFSWKRLKEMYSFSWKVLLSSLIDSLDGHARTLIIGLTYAPAALGFYTKGQQFPHLIMGAVNGSIQSVMLPILSSRQDDRLAVRAMMRRSMVMSSYVVFPAMVGMAAIAEPLIRLILTDKWLPAVPFLQIFCGVYALWPVHTANLQAIIALGRSDIYLRLEVAKKIIGLVILVLTIPLGPLGMAGGLLLSGLMASVVNAHPNARLLEYRYRDQVRDLAPTLALSALMGLVVRSLEWVELDPIVTLALQIVTGVIVYVMASYFLRLEPFVYSVGVARDALAKRRGGVKGN